MFFVLYSTMSNPDPCLVIKQEEADSSERDPESPEESGISNVQPRHDDVKLEIVEEELEESLEEASASPSSASGCEIPDNDGPSRLNRRKRKIPVKYNKEEEEEENFSNPEDQKGSHQAKMKYAVMTEERARNQAINAMPRSTCPICGDRANGLHYGIYTCEACKNFFKRSVVVDTSKTYVCKYNNACNVNITEVAGVKMKGPRCQACRYQACLDAGMYHSGVQRTRGGRHGYSPVKLASSGMSKYPTIPAPDISAVFAAAAAVSAVPAAAATVNNSNGHDEQVGGQDLMLEEPLNAWDNFCTDNAQNEVEVLTRKNALQETMLAEKTKQLELAERQIGLLKVHLQMADRVNKEQCAMIEKLKKWRTNGSTTLTRVYRDTDRQVNKMPVLFENGGVTITPVNSARKRLKSDNGMDLATIEPINDEETS